MNRFGAEGGSRLAACPRETAHLYAAALPRMNFPPRRVLFLSLLDFAEVRLIRLPEKCPRLASSSPARPSPALTCTVPAGEGDATSASGSEVVSCRPRILNPAAQCRRRPFAPRATPLTERVRDVCHFLIRRHLCVRRCPGAQNGRLRQGPWHCGAARRACLLCLYCGCALGGSCL